MLFPDLDEDTLFLSRSNIDEVLGTYSEYPFDLDGEHWLTVEHYFQGMKFIESSPEQFKKIVKAKTAKQAKRLGRNRLAKLRKDWKQVRRVVMTRAVYTKAKTHRQVAEALLNTGSRKIMENSQYDYYWGCGRDRRAENIYGQVLMDVREKLKEELES